MIRILHFSDVHVQEPFTALSARDLLNKRLLAAGNLWLTRGRFFREVPQKLAALAAFAEQEHIDLSLCTGDYTAMGTEAEYRRARAATAPLTARPLGGVAVPGNHDLYLPDTVRTSRFERHFGDLLKSDLPELAVDGPYPFVRLFGEHLAIVGVNSAKPNSNPFSSSGYVPVHQLAGLKRVLLDARVKDRFVIVMTHYGIVKRDGSPDSDHHGLKNWQELARACNRARLILVHGHIHGRYYHRASDEHPWLFCAGSTTHMGREGGWVYEVEADETRAIPLFWTGDSYALDAGAAVRVV